MVFCVDFGVLALYIYKIRKFTKDATNNASNNKVKMGLRKIIILTAIYECAAFVAAFNFILSDDSALGQIALQTKCLQCIDFLFLYLCIYFMVDHNNDKYMKMAALCKCKRKEHKKENETHRDYAISSPIDSHSSKIKSSAKTKNTLTVHISSNTTKLSTTTTTTTTCDTASGLPQLVDRVSLLDELDETR